MKNEPLNTLETFVKLSVINGDLSVNCEIEFLQDILDLVKGKETIPIFHPNIHMWECNSCGSAIHGDHSFCPNCGRLINWNKEKSDDQQDTI